MMYARLKKIYFWLEERILRFKRGKDVLFVVRNELMFNYAYSIYEILKSDKRLRFWFCFFDLAQFNDFPKLKRTHKLIWLPYKIAKRVKWDLILYPDHGPYFRNDTKKIYTGHGLATGKISDGTDYLFGPKSLDENGVIRYEKIFRSSFDIKEKIKVHHPSFCDRVRVVGSLFADELLSHANDDKKDHLERLQLDPQRKTIMICSTYGKNSLLGVRGDALADEVEDLSVKYNVILSLHFLFFVPTHYSGPTASSLLAKIKKNNVYVIPPEMQGIPFLPMADLLIADHTSLSLFYPVFRRPIIFFENPDVQLSPISVICSLKEAAHCIAYPSQFAKHVAQAFSEFDSNKMNEVVNKIFSYLGDSSSRHREEILDSLGLNQGSQF